MKTLKRTRKEKIFSFLWKVAAIGDTAILIAVAPFGWAMADGRIVLQILVIVTYAGLAWMMLQIIKYAFNQ